MFVKDVMTPVVLTVNPSDTLAHALELMSDSGHNTLVVIEQKIPKGVVAIRDIALYMLEHPNASAEEVSVSEATTENLATLAPDDVIEEAAFQLNKLDLDALPVIAPDTGRLAGIISTSDVLRAFIHLLGLRAKGARITLRVPDQVGVMAHICQIVQRSGLNIASVATFKAADQDETSVVLRVRSTEVESLINRLNAVGYKVVHESHVWK